MLLKLRIWSAVEGKDHFCQRREEISLDSDFLSMSYCSSDKTAENISLSHIAWSHTLLVSKNKDTGPYMVADDSD